MNNSHYVISICREYGSGGLRIGENLAKELNIPFYSPDYIAEAAQNEPFMTESNCDWLIDNNLKPSTLVGSAFAFGPVFGNVSSQLFLKESNVIWKLAKAGPCVVVGRCSDYILKDLPHSYRLFLSSGIVSRLRHIHENPKHYDVSIRKEAKDIVQMDKKRADYYHYYTGQTWGKASNYDLCIDTGRLGIRTINVIKEFVREGEELAKEIEE